MRNKWLMSLFIVILALPFFSSATFAEETKQFADGTYDINYTVKHEVKDEVSAADGYFTKPARFIVENGKQTIQLQLTSSSMIKSLKVAGAEVTVISEDKASNTKVVSFTAAGDLSEAVVMEMDVEVPGLYEMTHTARAFFDVSGVPVKEEVQPEEPTEPEAPVEEPIEEEATEDEVTEEPKEEQPVENANPALVPDEAFTINYVSDSGSVNRFFDNPAAVLHKDGETFIQMTGTGGQFIESLTINGKEVTWGKKNEDGTFTFQFKVDGSLATVLDFGMVIDARGTEMTHLEDLAFDESTKAEADVASFTLLADNNKPEVPAEKPDQEESNKPEDQEESVDKGENKQETPVKNPLAPDKAFEINFEFKHETEDKTSAADNFFVKPAILLEKDGERYIQITVTGSEYIDSLKNKFGDFIVVKTNADGSVVYQFKLDGSITDAMLIDMVISVPGVYENQAHKARLFFDESSMKEVDASKYLLAAAQNGNGPTGDGKSGNDFIPAKPELGGSDKNDNVKNQVKNSGKVTNPQTGDTTNIMLLVLLLIGSAIPLAVQLKRRIA